MSFSEDLIKRTKEALLLSGISAFKASPGSVLMERYHLKEEDGNITGLRCPYIVEFVVGETTAIIRVYVEFVHYPSTKLSRAYIDKTPFNDPDPNKNFYWAETVMELQDDYPPTIDGCVPIEEYQPPVVIEDPVITGGATWWRIRGIINSVPTGVWSCPGNGADPVWSNPDIEPYGVVPDCTGVWSCPGNGSAPEWSNPDIIPYGVVPNCTGSWGCPGNGQDAVWSNPSVTPYGVVPNCTGSYS